MTSPASLPAALRSHAEAWPFEPWLFYPHTRGWRWLSFAQAWRLASEDPGAQGSSGARDRIEEPTEPYVEAFLHELAHCDPLEQALDLDHRIRAATRPPSHRHVTVLPLPIETPLSRLHQAWATLTGAALLLEPTPSAHLTTAAWVRPTLIALNNESEATQLTTRARQTKTHSRSPFGRLRVLLIPNTRDLGEEDRAFWTLRGVKVLTANL